MKQYLKENSFRLVVAAGLMCALALGLIDSSMAAAGIMLDTAPLDIKALHEATQEALKKIGDQVREVGEKALAQAKKAGDASDEVKAQADQLLTKQGELQARLLEMEQKMARRSQVEQDKPKSLGESLVGSDEFKSFAAQGMKSKASSYVHQINAAITTTTGSNTTSVGVPPDTQPGVIDLPRRELSVRDLLLPGRTSSNSIWYVRQTGFTNNAAPVSEATARKPESTMTFEEKQSPVVTIAHFFKASKQILDDFPQLQSMIDGQGRYGLAIAEEEQLLKGSGVGLNLDGVYTQATAYSAPAGSPGSPTKIDVLRLMMLQAQIALFPPTAIALNPSDWAFIELSKDSQGRYIFADPQSMAQPRMWNLPVVPTFAMTQDTALVGAFRPSAQIFDRELVNVVISSENEDDFVRNLITIRIEERLALAVYRPESFIKNTNLPTT